MPPVGFEPTISADERPQTHALDRAATGTDNCKMYTDQIRFLATVYVANGLYSNTLDKNLFCRSHDSCIWPLEVPNSTDATHTQVAWLLVKYKRIRGKETQVSIRNENRRRTLFWFVPHLLTVSGKQKRDQYLYKGTIPTTWQISTSDKYKSILKS